MARTGPAIVVIPFLIAALSPCGVTPVHQELDSHAAVAHSQPIDADSDSDDDGPGGGHEHSKSCGSDLTLAKESKPDPELKSPSRRDVSDTVTVEFYPFAFAERLEAASRFDILPGAPPGRRIYALTQRLRI